MTLSDFFEALGNPNAVVTVSQKATETGAVTELVKLYASGYEQLLSATLALTVDSFTVVNANAITVVVNEE